MDFKNAQILITGGSDGIGRGLATRFLSKGNRVLITGRDKHRLDDARRTLPGVETFVSDVGSKNGRETLAQHIADVMPGINVLVNNAGIQRRIALADDHADWEEREQEIRILLSGPIHLNHLLIPLLLKHKEESLIVNVTSGGAYIPQTFAPVYSACKAALQSYTVTLRDALSNTKCKVIELIPPAVQTSLAGPGLNHGAPLNEFCDAVFNNLQKGMSDEIGYGPTSNLTLELSGVPVSILFQRSNSRYPTSKY